MRNRKIVMGAVAALVVAGTIGFGGTAANAALGGKGCTNGSQLVGEFRDDTASATWEVFDCGTVSVRVGYKTYSGSPTYVSSWAYGSANATRDPGNIRVYSNHSGTYVNGGSYFYLSD